MDYAVDNIAKNSIIKLYHCVLPVLGCTLSPNADNEYWNIVNLDILSFKKQGPRDAIYSDFNVHDYHV